MAKLETETPADLLHYEPPTTIGATKRQLVCIGAAIGLGLAVYLPLLFFTTIHPSNLSWVLILITVPFAALGWVRPYGLHFEVFLKMLWAHIYNNPPRSGVNERRDTHEQPKRRRDSECLTDYLPPKRRVRRARRRALRAASRSAYKEIKAQNRAWRKECRAQRRGRSRRARTVR